MMLRNFSMLRQSLRAFSAAAAPAAQAAAKAAPKPAGKAAAKPTVVGAPLPAHQVYMGEKLAGAEAALWKRQWTPASQRVGVIALKAGMTAEWDAWGVRRALTVLRLEDVVVTGVRTAEDRGYTALQVGAGLPKLKRVTRALAGQFESSGVAPRAVLAEFRVTPDALLPVGTPLLSTHFTPGQCVRVTATSQGKGFQGAMKRHGFSGQGASHGNSISHRVLGSTGCRQDPGKVFKGKKMPGHMGAVTVTTEGLRVYKVDRKHNLVFLEGTVPGKPGTYVRMTDSLKRAHPAPPPFPTYALTDDDRLQLAKWASGAYLSASEETALLAAGKLPAAYEQEAPYELVVRPGDVDPFAIPENDEPEAV